MDNTDFFSTENSTSFFDIPKNGKCHVIGVCGVAMAQIAIILSQNNYSVTGSDKEFYDPMKSLLKKHNVHTFLNFDPLNITEDIDLVIIGNSVGSSNVEVQEVKNKNLQYTFFPKILFELLIKNKHSIVISGTHGKSTISAIFATVLEKSDLSPSYFIGGEVKELDLSLKKGDGAYTVVEGDEYDSSFFAKIPKFRFYDPNTLIITSIEFDHADIYANLQEIIEQFNTLVLSRKNSDNVICCIDNENIRKCLQYWKNNAKCNLFTYGLSSEADFQILGRNKVNIQANCNEDFQQIQIADKQNDKIYSIVTPLSGSYNALNNLSVFVASIILKLDLEKVTSALKSFKGIKRRQDKILENKNVTLIEDFAHHPTAVKETLAGIRENYINHKIIAIFEPRSNTSRKKIFQADYGKAFNVADEIIIKEVSARFNDNQSDLMDVHEIGKEIKKICDKEAFICSSINLIEDLVTNFVQIKYKNQKVCIVVMSNGSFEGLIANLKAKLS